VVGSGGPKPVKYHIPSAQCGSLEKVLPPTPQLAVQLVMSVGTGLGDSV